MRQIKILLVFALSSTILPFVFPLTSKTLFFLPLTTGRYRTIELVLEGRDGGEGVARELVLFDLLHGLREEQTLPVIDQIVTHPIGIALIREDNVREVHP